MQISKRIMPFVAVILLIVIAVVVIAINKNNRNNKLVATQTEQQQSNSTEENSNASTNAESNIPTNSSNLSYNEALKKYGANRIQFKTDCQATPSNITYKSGTQVMFDNRSSTSHVISFNGAKYTIAGYGYRVITMSAAKYPATILVDCDKSQNVATVLIQK